MGNLDERLDKIERSLDGHDDQHVICIVLVRDKRDLAEMPSEPSQWLIYPQCLAEASPIGPTIIHLDPREERVARVAAATRN